MFNGPEIMPYKESERTGKCLTLKTTEGRNEGYQDLCFFIPRYKIQNKQL